MYKLTGEKKLLNRYDENISDKNVHSILTPEIVEFLLEKMKIKSDISYFIRHTLFDKMAARLPHQYDILYIADGFALDNIMKAKREGHKVIIDRGLVHPMFVDEVLKEEYHRQGLALSNPDRRLLDRRMKEYENADGIVVVSETVKKTFVKSQPNVADKIFVNYLGVDINVFTPPGNYLRKKEKVHFLFVGLVSIRKGIPYLLDAFKKIRHCYGKKAKLIIAGKLEPGCKTILSRYEDVIDFRGEVPFSKMANLYQEADVFVFPSLAEG
ncbi:unnamed protein product, partial [marine sediment metagenome]